MENTFERIYALVRQILRGRVATYGQIARLIGREKNARLVGKVLSRAEHYGLGVSGGSDFHGTRKTHIALGTGMGDLAVPYSVLENLKALRD